MEGWMAGHAEGWVSERADWLWAQFNAKKQGPRLGSLAGHSAI
jgi:hypothetical protein